MTGTKRLVAMAALMGVMVLAALASTVSAAASSVHATKTASTAAAHPMAAAVPFALQNAHGQCNGPNRIQANSPAMWLTAIGSEGVTADAANYATSVGYSPRDSTLSMWVRERTMIVRLPYPVTVMDYYCPDGQHRMLPWKPKVLPAGWPVLVVLPPDLSLGSFSLTPRAGYTARSVTFQILAQPSCGNVSTGRVTITVYVPGKATAPPATCKKKNATNYGGPLPCTYATPTRWTVFTAKIAWKWDSSKGQWVKVTGVPVTIRRFVGKKPVQSWRIYSGGKWYRLTGKGKRPTKLCEVTKKTDLYQPRYGAACVAVKWNAKDRAWEAVFVNQTKKGTPPGTTPPPNSPPSSPPGPGTVPKTPPNNPGGGGPGDPNQGNPQPPGTPDTPPGGSSAPPPGPPSACDDPNNTDACQPPPS